MNVTLKREEFTDEKQFESICLQMGVDNFQIGVTDEIELDATLIDFYTS